MMSKFSIIACTIVFNAMLLNAADAMPIGKGVAASNLQKIHACHKMYAMDIRISGGIVEGPRRDKENQISDPIATGTSNLTWGLNTITFGRDVVPSQRLAHMAWSLNMAVRNLGRELMV